MEIISETRRIEDMTKLFEGLNRESQIPEKASRMLSVYSFYEIIAESLETGEERQAIFVPTKEYEFYSRWRQYVKNELTSSGQNAAFIKNIMRHHDL